MFENPGGPRPPAADAHASNPKILHHTFSTIYTTIDRRFTIPNNFFIPPLQNLQNAEKQNSKRKNLEFDSFLVHVKNYAILSWVAVCLNDRRIPLHLSNPIN